jgi:uracil-DNA glycosylase
MKTSVSVEPKMFDWKQLNYWNTGEWQVVEERLEDLKKAHKVFNPARKDLFNSLDACPFEKVKVCLIGQDPYPSHDLATGFAFSIPKASKTIPKSLSMIFDEYVSDLHYPRPSHGSLLKWCTEGVLLWNAVPSCLAGHSLSHDWYEWSLLTEEIVKKLSEKGIVFILLGSKARSFAPLVNQLENCRVIECVHPSPRANLRNPKHPFVGSRVFTSASTALVQLGLEPIEWRL